MTPAVLEMMKATDYAEVFIDSKEFDTLCQEMYWEDEYSPELCLKVMSREAKKDGIELAELDAFDYDKFFWNAYQCMEKGLS